MKSVLTSLRMLGFMTILTGVFYPVVITILSQSIFKQQANGSLIMRDEKVVGSELLAQKFESPRYFWPRPSAADYSPLPSGGSNLGPTSADLKIKVDERRAKLATPDVNVSIPQDLLFASGSGLDPHISVEAAMYQVSRVAQARGMDPNELKSIVEKFIEPRQLKILGEPRVNVLALNLAMDHSSR